MKKLILGLLATFLMTSGFVAFSGTPANAIEKCGKYQDCTRTRIITKNSQEGSGEVFDITVDAIGTKVKPAGTVTVVVRKPGGKLVYSKSKKLDGKANAGFKASALAKGSYNYGIAYTSAKGTTWLDSDDGGSFKIK